MSDCNCSEFPNTFPYQIQAEDIVGETAENVEFIAQKFGKTFADLMPLIYACFPNENPPTIGDGQVGTTICIPGTAPDGYVEPVNEPEPSTMLDYNQPVQTPDGLVAPPQLFEGEYILYYDEITYEFLIRNTRTNTERIVRVWWPSVQTPDGLLSPPPLQVCEAITYCDSANYTFHIVNHCTNASRQVRVWWPSVETPDGIAPVPTLQSCESIQSYDAANYTFHIFNHCTGLAREVQVWCPCSYTLIRNPMNTYSSTDLNAGEGEAEQNGGGSFWLNFWQQACGNTSENFDQDCAEECFLDFFAQEIHSLLGYLVAFRHEDGAGGRSSGTDFLRNVSHIHRILTTEQEWLDLAQGSYQFISLLHYLEGFTFTEIIELYVSLNSVATPEESDLIPNEAAESYADAYLFAYAWEMGISLPFDAYANFNPNLAYEDWLLRTGEGNIRNDLIAAIARIMRLAKDSFGYLPEFDGSETFDWNDQDVFGAIDNLGLDMPALIAMARHITDTIRECMENVETPCTAYADVDITISLFELNNTLEGYDTARTRDKIRQLLYTPTWHKDYTGPQLDELQKLVNEMPALILGVDVRFSRAQMQRYVNTMRQLHNWRVAIKPGFDTVENIMMNNRDENQGLLGPGGKWLLLIFIEVGASILLEPVDWILTVRDLMHGDWLAIVGLLPFVPGVMDDLATMGRNLPNINSLDELENLGDAGRVWDNDAYANLVGEIDNANSIWANTPNNLSMGDSGYTPRTMDDYAMGHTGLREVSEYAENPSNDLFYGLAVDSYNEILSRNSAEMTRVISDRTGIPEEVISRVYSHVFDTQHSIMLADGSIVYKYFSPNPELGFTWLNALGDEDLARKLLNTAKDNLIQAGADSYQVKVFFEDIVDMTDPVYFNRYTAHEYVELSLMERGFDFNYGRDAHRSSTAQSPNKFPFITRHGDISQYDSWITEIELDGNVAYRIEFENLEQLIDTIENNILGTSE